MTEHLPHRKPLCSTLFMISENIVGNVALAHEKQMLHFPHFFPKHLIFDIFVYIRNSFFYLAAS